MRRLVTRKDVVLVAHNCVQYDIPVMKRLLDVDIVCKVADTLAISWYLYPKRAKHGLGDWGEEFGIPKPVVEDWDNQPIEVYLHRVEEDVKINTMLWEKMLKDLRLLYPDEGEMWRLINYLTFKMECVQEQREHGWKLDIPKAEAGLSKVTKIRDERFEKLQKVMPTIPIKKLKTPPAEPYKQSGDLSVYGKNWFGLLEEMGLPKDTLEVEIIEGHKEPNAGSVPQLKSWLYSLGWLPETFNYKRDKETGDVRKIPQINIKDSGGDVCPSVKRLYKVNPDLEVLEGLSIAKHRVGLFQGLLRDVDENGYVRASMQGLTNTLRLKHKEVVNLPGVDKLYAVDIRGSLTCPEGYVLGGSDMSSLEDRTKQHYMWDYDPDYVREMMTPDFDPHLDVAVAAGGLTKQQADDHKAGVANYKGVRHKYKQVNYSAVYGVGAESLSRSTGGSKKEAKELIEAYWKRNWSVKSIAEGCVVKKVKGQMWLYNPVSKFWYSLRYEKDRFSTLNQGTGVYCFDMWVRFQRDAGLKVIGQFHDETISLVKLGDEEKTSKILKDAIHKVNKVLKLNRDLDCDVCFGNNYAEIH